MQLERVGPYLWRIPRDEGRGMRVPGLIVADEHLIASIRSDASLEQLANGATLPGIVRAALAMPDIHQGYGLPVGGVVATGMERLVDALYAAIPTGVGSRGALTLDARMLDEVTARGAAWAVERGYGVPDDLERIESGGGLDGADPGKVSERARERGRRQLGTLGSGNHFLEVQVVDEIDDARTAEALGIRLGQVMVMIHTGSRGLGHQVCTDYLEVAGRALRRYGDRKSTRLNSSHQSTSRMPSS